MNRLLLQFDETLTVLPRKRYLLVISVKGKQLISSVCDSVPGDPEWKSLRQKAMMYRRLVA